jgi:hypothetical protein
MTLPGHDDERTEDEPEGIRYFDFSDPFGPPEDEPGADPFVSEALGAGHAAETTRATRSARPPLSSAQPGEERPYRDDFEFALVHILGSDEATSSDPLGEDRPSEPPGVAFSPLSSFVEPGERSAAPRARFVAAFDTARRDRRPFLAIALHMAAGASGAAEFPAVEQGIRAALGPDDTLLTDPDRLRLVAVLPGRGAEAARPLFARLVDYLREHVAEAETVGHGISVLAAPDGRPFQRAAAFLTATFDEA